MARPTDYRAVYAKQVYKLCLLGATDIEMAAIFSVTVSTFYLWQQKHPKFSEAIKAGKVDADANIAESLYHRAKGYSHPDVDIRVIDGQIVKTDIIKHYPPDTAAAFIWLKNRQRGRWQDKQEVNISGDVKIGNSNLAQRISGDEQLAELAGELLKRISSSPSLTGGAGMVGESETVDIRPAPGSDQP